MAGMLCFTCDPRWQPKVLMDDTQVHVTHLIIHDSSNEALWLACKDLGSAATQMYVRIADSQLAKSVSNQLADLRMFASKAGVAEYMAQNGLLAMRGPNE